MRIGSLSRVFFTLLFLFCVLVPSARGAPVTIYDDLFSVTFPTEKDGWACGRWGTIIHTEDGGTTWSPQESGTTYTLSSIHFINGTTGWAVGNQGTILHTKDGGKTWQKQQSPVPYFLMGVHFVTPDKGFICTEQTTILATDDGGKTWSKQFSDMDYILRTLSFSDPMNGWAAGEYGFIYHTADGGKTWAKQAGDFRISPETGDVEGGYFVFTIVALDAKTVWAAGIDGSLMRTVDGGQTWGPVKTGAPKIHFFGLAVNKAGGIALAGSGILLVSTDNGRTWAFPPVAPPIKYGWLYGLAPRGNGFVATGWQGAIYMGEGSSWKRVNN
jgi:photosystem II stability/assembly factor-like uncharacterized protein